MSIKIIEDHLKEYASVSQRDELNALKEIAQEIALCALARTDFFKHAAFQGDSCLRIVHHINRFSEDLDFMLLSPNQKFVWEPFLKTLQLEFASYGLQFHVIDRSKADHVIKTAFLKDTSFGKVLLLTHQRGSSDKQTIQIKLEIDTNPPAASLFEPQFLDFPYPFSITTQDLPSLFASKCHALLCRKYVKGRDWFDFVWYVSKKVPVNYQHLQEGLRQAEPWHEDKALVVTKEWFIHAFEEKIKRIDWSAVRQDVEVFLKPRERESLAVWGADFFLSTLKKLADILA